MKPITGIKRPIEETDAGLANEEGNDVINDLYDDDVFSFSEDAFDFIPNEAYQDIEHIPLSGNHQAEQDQIRGIFERVSPDHQPFQEMTGTQPLEGSYVPLAAERIEASYLDDFDLEDMRYLVNSDEIGQIVNEEISEEEELESVFSEEEMERELLRTKERLKQYVSSLNVSAYSESIFNEWIQDATACEVDTLCESNVSNIAPSLLRIMVACGDIRHVQSFMKTISSPDHIKTISTDEDALLKMITISKTAGILKNVASMYRGEGMPDLQEFQHVVRLYGISLNMADSISPGADIKNFKKLCVSRPGKGAFSEKELLIIGNGRREKFNDDISEFQSLGDVDQKIGVLKRHVSSMQYASETSKELFYDWTQGFNQIQLDLLFKSDFSRISGPLLRLIDVCGNKEDVNYLMRTCNSQNNLYKIAIDEKELSHIIKESQRAGILDNISNMCHCKGMPDLQEFKDFVRMSGGSLNADGSIRHNPDSKIVKQICTGRNHKGMFSKKEFRKVAEQFGGKFDASGNVILNQEGFIDGYAKRINALKRVLRQDVSSMKDISPLSRNLFDKWIKGAKETELDLLINSDRPEILDPLLKIMAVCGEKNNITILMRIFGNAQRINKMSTDEKDISCMIGESRRVGIFNNIASMCIRSDKGMLKLNTFKNFIRMCGGACNEEGAITKDPSKRMIQTIGNIRSQQGRGMFTPAECKRLIKNCGGRFDSQKKAILDENGLIDGYDQTKLFDSLLKSKITGITVEYPIHKAAEPIHKAEEPIHKAEEPELAHIRRESTRVGIFGNITSMCRRDGKAICSISEFKDVIRMCGGACNEEGVISKDPRQSMMRIISSSRTQQKKGMLSPEEFKQHVGNCGGKFDDQGEVILDDKGLIEGYDVTKLHDSLQKKPSAKKGKSKTPSPSLERSHSSDRLRETSPESGLVGRL